MAEHHSHEFFCELKQHHIDDFRAGLTACPVVAAMLECGLRYFNTDRVRVRNGNLQAWKINNTNNHAYWESYYPSPYGREIAQTAKYRPDKLRPTSFDIYE